MIVNIDTLISKFDRFTEVERMGIGINRTISISKTIKIMASRKNRKENGIRALWFGSNPHSNGEAFSRFRWSFIEVMYEIIYTITGKIIAIEEEIENRIIY